MLLGRSMLLAAGPTPLTFRAVGETFNAPSGGAMTKPAGVAVGDLVILVTVSGADGAVATTSGSTWTKDSGATQRLYWKVLDATDVANNWVWTGAGTVYLAAIAYSNAGQTISSVAVSGQTDAGPSVTSLTIPGAGPSAAGRPRAVIAALATNNSAVWVTPSQPTDFTMRAISSVTASVADRMLGYSGTSATWTGLTSEASTVYSGWLVRAW